MFMKVIQFMNMELIQEDTYYKTLYIEILYSSYCCSIALFPLSTLEKITPIFPKIYNELNKRVKYNWRTF